MNAANRIPAGISPPFPPRRLGLQFVAPPPAQFSPYFVSDIVRVGRDAAALPR